MIGDGRCCFSGQDYRIYNGIREGWFANQMSTRSTNAPNKRMNRSRACTGPLAPLG